MNGYKATKDGGHISLSHYKIGYDHTATKTVRGRGVGQKSHTDMLYREQRFFK
jgi:hypothetical protein